MDIGGLMTALDNIVLEQMPDGRFIARSGVPTWCRSVRPLVEWEHPVVIEDVFPFLAVFLPEATRTWHDANRSRADSDLWAEVHDGEEVHLSAVAIRIDGARALVIVRSERMFLESQALLQRARELRLTHDALMREIEQKDILAHAIVHDLAAPLHSIIGVLSLLDEKAHSEPEAGWIRLASDAARRQRDLIGEILDVFVAEGGSLAREVADVVVLSDVVDHVVSERSPLARSRNLRIEKEEHLPASRVVGDERRLFRILTNLIDNAVRYSPRGGVVRLSALQTGDAVTVFVDDEGPGVRPDVLPRLFEKFARSRDRRSGTGLGLFFCRITIESWGGAIGYEQREAGGARFWIRLRLAPS